MTVLARRVRIACLLILVGTGVAGCFQTSQDQVDPNIYPAEYKKEIVDTLIKVLDDATNVREAGVSEPQLRDVSGVSRYMNCVRFNPRNANHEYIGVVERVGYYYGGHLTQLVKPPGDECRGAAYNPFPELEKICFGTKCV